MSLGVLELFVFTKETKEEKKLPLIALTTFSLYDITTHIAGDTFKIVNILPLGVDPHSFEPTPKLMAEIQKSSLVLLTGAGLEPWIKNIEFKSRVVDLSKFVHLRELSEDHESHAHSKKGQDSEHTVDPHYWLDFQNMQKMAIMITAELIKLQPKNRAIYEKNRDNYLNTLATLDTNYKKALASCKSDTLIVNHNSVGYLAQRYGFKVESLSGLSPEAQPTPQDVKRIFQDIKQEHAKSIFFENFVNNKAIQSIANDAGISLEVFHSLGNITAEEAEAKRTYKDLMQENLKKLQKALDCN